MKTCITRPCLLLAFCLAFCSAHAQKINIWKGGQAGQETDWNCPQNWSNRTVPDAFSDVLVPDVSTSTRAMPVIQSGCFELNALHISPGAVLTIAAGAELKVLDRLEGITSGSLRGEGTLLMLVSLKNDAASVGSKVNPEKRSQSFDAIFRRRAKEEALEGGHE